MEYVEGTEIYDVDCVWGYGARLSAPGYLDCTEWIVFNTEQAAWDYLEDQFGDEDL